MTEEKPPRRLLTRRRTLSLIGAAGVAGLATAVGCGSSDNNATATASSSASATATSGSIPTATAAATATQAATAAPTTVASINCVAVPALTEGPYFVDELLNRSDIRPDPTTGITSAGTPLELTVRVFNSACAPLSGANVDLWHCDASGKYSDESANNTVGQKFLRGYQTTDATGTAKFTTIYPGWYQGRAVHIHFKIRNYDGANTAGFTSQFFFDDTQSDTVFQQAPYSNHGTRDTRNSNDNIYGQSNGETLLTLTPSGNGYAGTFGVSLPV